MWMQFKHLQFRKLTNVPWKSIVGRCISYWKFVPFKGDIRIHSLVFRGVYPQKKRKLHLVDAEHGNSCGLHATAETPKASGTTFSELRDPHRFNPESLRDHHDPIFNWHPEVTEWCKMSWTKLQQTVPSFKTFLNTHRNFEKECPLEVQKKRLFSQ